MSVDSPLVLGVLFIATSYISYATYRDNNKPLSFMSGLLCACFLVATIYVLLR